VGDGRIGDGWKGEAGARQEEQKNKIKTGMIGELERMEDGRRRKTGRTEEQKRMEDGGRSKTGEQEQDRMKIRTEVRQEGQKNRS
jgi:hypothetical protein